MKLLSDAVPLGWAILLAVGACFIALKRYAAKKVDPREPPVVSSAIPFVGHLIGMLMYGSLYFKRIGEKNRYPIFTLPNLNSRLYIVTDPSLAMSVQRATKALSFNPIVPPVLQRVPGMDHATAELIKSDMETGFVQRVQEKVHAKLGQGEYLDRLTLRACNEFLIRINDIKPGQPETVDLVRWVKRLVTVATATFFYGPENPVERDPRLIDQFWDFDAGIPGLLVGVMPSITARKAYRGREAVVTALKEYLISERYEQAADITKERTEIARRFNVDAENTARSDLTFFFAGIINTSLTSFWMILHIFAQPELLSRVRAELEAVLEPSENGDAPTYMSVKRVVRECGLLTAVFREVLRLYSDNFATRVVQSDTLLADTYFLRKGSILQISGGIIHADSRIWGEDVAQFRPERFLSPAAADINNKAAQGENVEKSEKKPKSIHKAAFRAFGGGATLCPGRHFALNEILGLVAMVVLLLDVAPAGGAAQLSVPAKDDKVVPIHVLEPKQKVSVRISRRKEWAARRLELTT